MKRVTSYITTASLTSIAFMGKISSRQNISRDLGSTLEITKNRKKITYIVYFKTEDSSKGWKEIDKNDESLHSDPSL